MLMCGDSEAGGVRRIGSGDLAWHLRAKRGSGVETHCQHGPHPATRTNGRTAWEKKNVNPWVVPATKGLWGN